MEKAKVGNELDAGGTTENEIVSIIDGMISSVVLAQINTVPKNPLEIPEVMEVICKKISNLGLLRMRPVSKVWNEEASRIFLRRKVCRLKFSFDQFNVLPVKERESRIQYRYYNISDCQLQELISLLRTSKNPQLLLKYFSVTIEEEEPTGILSCENLLKEFGKSITCLDIRESEDFALVQRILGQEKPYCPNVEVLNFDTSTTLAETTSDPQPLKAVHSPWKLQDLALRSESATLRAPEHLALSIMQNAPFLTSIHIYSDHETFMACAIEVLKSMPQMTSNLTTLSLRGHVLPHFKELSSVKFSKKLTKVKLFDLTERSATPSEESDLMNFLEIVGHSFEKFKMYEDMEFPRLRFTRDLPSMPKVQELLLWGYRVDLTDGADFLRKLPSLKIIKFGLGEDRHFHEFVEKVYQAGVEHQNIEKFYLGGNHANHDGCIFIENPTTIRLINKVFPKMKDLDLELREVPEGTPLEDVRTWMEELFLEISKMNNLKYLNIYLGQLHNFGPVVYSEAKLDLTVALGNLKESPCLESIEIMRQNFRYKFEEELSALELPDFPMLWNISFHGFKMEEREELKKKLQEEFAQRNIIFQTEEPYYVGDGQENVEEEIGNEDVEVNGNN